MQDLTKYQQHKALFFTEEGIIVQEQSNQFLLPLAPTIDILQLTIQASHLHHEIIFVRCKTNFSSKEILNMGFQVVPLRSFLSNVKPSLQSLVLKAIHWINWNEQSQFCGKCARKLQNQFNEMEKKCSSCLISFFPKFSPAVMVIVHRKHEILLARSSYFRPGVFSAIAGFIEPGESAEEAAHREVKEELGIEITHLTYFSTQAWPFPDSFMIAFKAEYLKGELQVDNHEIEEARWFPIDDLPKLPFKASIAWALIQNSVADIDRNR